MTKLEKLRGEIDRRGLKLERVGSHAWRVTGHKVDILTTDLEHLHLQDLAPALEAPVKNHR